MPASLRKCIMMSSQAAKRTRYLWTRSWNCCHVSKREENIEKSKVFLNIRYVRRWSIETLQEIYADAWTRISFEKPTQQPLLWTDKARVQVNQNARHTTVLGLNSIVSMFQKWHTQWSKTHKISKPNLSDWNIRHKNFPSWCSNSKQFGMM